MLVVGGIFHRWNRQTSRPEVLMFRRAAWNSGGGQYEFPGGKVEAGETEPEALRREMLEELQIQVEVGDYVAESRFRGTRGQAIQLKVYWVDGPLATIHRTEHDDQKWVSQESYEADEISLGDRPLMEDVFAALNAKYAKKS